MVPYLVSAFGRSTLSNLVKECFGSDFPDVFQKKQIGYIYRYLKDLGAESILLEFDYLDRDYLEDYSRYYVKRFDAGGSKCARLHFFSTVVEHNMVEAALAVPSGIEREKLQENYLGYAVIKPLPRTFIGRTCLAMYGGMIEDNGSKNLLSRNYDVDLFGIRLKVRSIAFQEQDKVVSACATTAIWTALQAVPWRQVRDIPACSEITINAINHIDGSSNSFPSRELSNKQILRALDVESLRNHHLPLDDTDQASFLKIVKYHVDSSLPLILGAEVYAMDSNNNAALLAGHAVTVLGYKASQNPAIYIHDDRLGPYARASFFELKKLSNSQDIGKATWGLVLQEKNENGWLAPHEVLVPKSLVIPSHKKVRLPFSFADSTANFIREEYENWLLSLRAQGKDVAELQGRLGYKIKLAEISNIRQEVINWDYSRQFREGSQVLDTLNAKKVAFLTKSYARFHWVVDFMYEGSEAFQILFDATDIPQGNAVVGLFVKHYESAQAVLSLFEKYAASANQIKEPQTENFYVSFLKQLRAPEGTYEDHLNITYGQLRAPKYLKPNEVIEGVIAKSEFRKQYFVASEKSLDEEFPDIKVDDENSFMIWAIAYDGSLLIGKEVDGVGHPGLTGFKPARIAGELHRLSSGWVINSKSGRYSGDYPNAGELLKNAAEKFATVFYKSRGNLEARIFSKK